MPTVRMIGPYRFFFYSGDRDEPPHIHVERDQKIAKFWITPVRLQRNGGFSQGEISKIMNKVVENKSLFMEAWDEYFSS